VRERRGFVYARKIETPGRGKAIRALSAHPVERLAKRFAERLAADVLRLLRELADGEVRLLLAGASFTEGYTAYLHHRPMAAWALRLASHLA
jgi:hypothetical protein